MRLNNPNLAAKIAKLGQTIAICALLYNFAT